MPERKPFGQFLFETLQIAAQAGLDITQQAKNTRQEKQLLALDLALKERTHAEGIRQFNQLVKEKRESLRQKASQFDISAGLAEREVAVKEKKVPTTEDEKREALTKYIEDVRKDPNIKTVIKSQLEQEKIRREDADPPLPPMNAQQELNFIRNLTDGAIQDRLINDVAGGLVSLDDVRSIGRFGLVNRGDISNVLQAFAPPRTDVQIGGLIGEGEMQGPPAPPPPPTIFERGVSGVQGAIEQLVFGSPDRKEKKSEARGESEVEMALKRLVFGRQKNQAEQQQEQLLQNIQQTGLTFQNPLEFLNNRPQ